jgi:uncharacterized repeat protein (TIGR03803 family)
MFIMRTVGATLAAMALLPACAAQAQTLTTIYTFAGGDDGLEPSGGLTHRDGLLYGTTQYGGPVNAGTVFKLDPATGAKTLLHTFDRTRDGEFPQGLIYQGGALWINLEDGGKNNEGTLVKVNHRTGVRKLLTSFNDKSGGVAPLGRLTYQDGLFYGATFGDASGACGGDGCGTIFTYNPATNIQATLYTFKGPPDGAVPDGDMVYRDGSFYGVTWYGGGSGNGQQDSGGGTLFKLDPKTGAETQLYSFSGGVDGKTPSGSLTLFGSTIYGSTFFGGKFDNGVIFKLDLETGVESVLYNFTGGSDGSGPNGSLLLKDGALYGSTTSGGANFGVIFKLDLATDTETVLYTFSGHSDGSYPVGGLLYKDHALFGEAQFGGVAFDLQGAGTIFKLVP